MDVASRNAKNLGELVDCYDWAQQEFGSTALAFRGVDSRDYELIPTVFRPIPDHPPPSHLREKNMIAHFRLWAQAFHSNCPDQEDKAAWLALMRHHGLPVRLLDWTEALLAASFFACCERLPVFSQKPACIWILETNTLNSLSIPGAGLVPLSDAIVEHLVDGAFDGIAGKPGEAVAVVARHVHVRQIRQQSLFTIHGDTCDLRNHPQASRFLRRIDISPESKVDIAQSLIKIGIRSTMFFPDLDRLAWQLATTNYS